MTATPTTERESVSGPAPTLTPVTFEAFPKIGRLFRDMVVSEKIDGTNAAVGVTEDGRVYAQSRKRLVTPESDNFGFARWVAEHEDELRDGLGHGLHFGEWWGSGIQRGYGLPQGEKRFSLFNSARWGDERPECCHVVPVLCRYTFDTAMVLMTLDGLARTGSLAAPGYMKPEGVVVYHAATNSLYKATLDGDAEKTEQIARAA